MTVSAKWKQGRGVIKNQLLARVELRLPKKEKDSWRGKMPERNPINFSLIQENKVDPHLDILIPAQRT